MNDRIIATLFVLTAVMFLAPHLSRRAGIACSCMFFAAAVVWTLVRVSP